MVSYGWMDRREFLRIAGLGAYAAGSPAWLAGGPARRKSTPVIDLTVNSSQRLGAVPADFMGLGYEISSIATPGLLSAANHIYVELVREGLSALAETPRTTLPSRSARLPFQHRSAP
jgi:hypothetical protein